MLLMVQFLFVLLILNLNYFLQDIDMNRLFKTWFPIRKQMNNIFNNEQNWHPLTASHDLEALDEILP